MFSRCKRYNVFYITGMAQNKRLLAQCTEIREQAETQFTKIEAKQRLFSEVQYAAKSWSKKRRVIVKTEHTHKGANTRFVVTNLDDDPQHLYDKTYCARGDMENRIKEQIQLFSDRTSCHRWWANQFRFLLSSVAYILISNLRRISLADTQLAKAHCNTIRLKLFKIGAVIIRNTRRIRFLLSSSYPYQDVFKHAAAKLYSG